jgi:hypothetical protein
MVLLLALLVSIGSPAGAQELAGCPMLPKNNIWNIPVDRMPVHPRSVQLIASNGVDKNLHPDFSAAGGIPINIVPADQAMVAIEFAEGKAESDPGPYPIPPNVSIEQGSDAHALILQRGVCKLYEIFVMRRLPSGGWGGYSGAVFDLRSNALRPDGWTSSDAAGLPIVPGLIRFDEIEAGEIRHAIRMTVQNTRREYVWPGRHYASRSEDPDRPPMGMRFRLRAGYDISGFDPKVQVLLRALKKYGMILADNGQSFYLTGATDTRWNDDLWSQVKRIKGTEMEALDVSTLMLNPNSGQAGVLSTVGRQDIAFSPTPEFDLQAASSVSMTLTGDVTSSAATNLPDGAQVAFLICQDATGGRQFAWPPQVSGGMRIGTTARTCSAQQFVSDGKALYATSPGVTDLPVVH